MASTGGLRQARQTIKRQACRVVRRPSRSRAGNRTAEATKDARANLTRQLSRTYDLLNRLTEQRDAQNRPTGYGYDALNRLTSIDYADSTLDTAFHYDEANGVTGCSTSSPTGRLTRMIDASGITAYCYDRRGNVIQKRLTTESTTRTVGYAHTKGDRRSAIIYPDGTQIGYGRNTLGQIVTIGRINKPFQSIVTNTAYTPFGPIAQVEFAGNGQQSWSYDLNYRPTGFGEVSTGLQLVPDARGNIVNAIDNSGIVPKTYAYRYDPLSRLLGVSSGGSSSSRGPLLFFGGVMPESFTYDATGNRLTKTGGQSTQAYAYPTDSHRLTAIDSDARTYDAMGNLTARGNQTLVYGEDQRLKQFTLNGSTEADYVHNGKGERTRKTLTSTGTQVEFIYDEQGTLLAEYTTVGASPASLQRLYVWLDERPVTPDRGVIFLCPRLLHVMGQGPPDAVVGHSDQPSHVG